MQRAKWGFTRQDVFVLFVLVLIGILISIFIYLPSKSSGSFLEIRQNGRVIKTLPLTENHTETITSESGGKNTFSIQDRTVAMTSADCGDHTCVRTGSIHKVGESIVCLPHRLVLRISANKEDSENGMIDAIVQ